MAVLQILLFSAVVCLTQRQVLSQDLDDDYWAGNIFGFGGGLGGGFNPYMPYSGYSGYSGGQQSQQPDEVMTCINSNPQDPSSTIRLTIKPEDDMGYGAFSHGGHGGGFGGFGGMGGGHLMRGRDSDTPRDWNIQGLFRPSTVQAMTGTYQVVVTTYGARTNEGCNPVALGSAIQSRRPAVTPSPFFGNPLLRGMGSGGGFGGFRAPVYRPAGHLNNPILVTQGGLTVYAARLHGVSKSQLLGAGVAVCPQVSSQGQCLGVVMQCCTIAKDQLPVSRVYVQGQNQGNLGTFGGVGSFGAVGSFGGVGIPGSFGDDDGVLGFGVAAGGSSAPFQLAFTDPTAASSASASSKQEDSNARPATGLF